MEHLTIDDIYEIRQIAIRLSEIPICLACEVESQQHTCTSIEANELGLRLFSIIEQKIKE
jgi:hypothetical protein